MRYLFTTSLLVICFYTFAQPVTPVDWELKRFMINDKKIGPVGFYVDTVNIKKKAPLLIYLNGSGGYPLCFYVEKDSSAMVMTTFESNMIRKAKEAYHLVLIDKPGLNFCDTVRAYGNDPDALLENYSPPAYYTENLSLTWRTQSARAVITYLIRNRFYDKTKIIAWGFSEGGQVVPEIAATDDRITHVVAMVGSGLNQFYDNIAITRVKVAKGELSHEEGQREVDRLLAAYKDIYANPNATSKTYWGHSYKRWSSFCTASTLARLTELSIPIYMVAGSADNNSPIYGLDYVPLEFLRLGKNNLTYDVCVGCDHFQNVIETTDDKRKGLNLGDQYIEKIMTWIEANPGK